MADRRVKNIRRTIKGRTGCKTCKRRRLKCDETRPQCLRCVKYGVECPGYDRPMIWCTKYEKLRQNNHNDCHDNEQPAQWFSEEVEKASAAIRLFSSETEEPLNTHKKKAPCIGSSPGASSSGPSPVAPHIARLTYAPPDQAMILLNHYFVSVCQINCSFDSPKNPFRSLVGGISSDSRLIFYCVLSMSAAHLYRDEKESSIALGFHTEAISCLLQSLTALKAEENLGSLSGSKQVMPATCSTQEEVLLASILLGMTSTWHNAFSQSVAHLQGARTIFQAWLSSIEDPIGNRLYEFLVPLMVYWEAMSAFVIDQDKDVLDYLDVFTCTTSLDSPKATDPHPWTGVGVHAFALLGKVGTLLRCKRTLDRYATNSNDDMCATSAATLDKSATILEREILRYQPPLVYLVQDVDDPRTSSGQFCSLARCYRLAALLELYGAFPHLGQARSEAAHKRRILDLSIRVLRMLEGVPDNSGTISVQNMALIIAGSALGPLSTKNKASNDEIHRWRTFVRQRVIQCFRVVGLRPVKYSAMILNDVWQRLDQGEHVHWVDVMADRGLETIFG